MRQGQGAVAAATCLLLFSAFVVVGGLPPSGDGSHGPTSVDYFTQVRPILSQYCYGCHGPDEKKRKADLRLDLKEGAFADSGTGEFPVVPGNPGASMLIQRITTSDPDDRMPPESTGHTLKKSEIETLKQWVADGATWPTHWGFEKIGKPEPPGKAGEKWNRNGIDNFILAHLREAGHKPVQRADKTSLIRRLSFDLTGMPPTCAEIDLFLEDDSADAYGKLVDRLLASERYGERQAQDWLDLARYADTNGYQADGGREAWKWREWVIKAYNQNMAFDQFTIEQLAGDLLPNATLDQKIATGFNRNHATNSEAGSEIDEYRSAYVIDRVDATATTWLGLTLACAQCHDHKYDPLPQQDFYRFYAFFNQVNEKSGGFRNAKPSMRIPNPDQSPHQGDLKRRIEELKMRLKSKDTHSDVGQAAWEKKLRKHVGDDVRWKTAVPVGMLARNGSILRTLDDGSVLAEGEAPVRDTYDLVFKPGQGRIAAMRLEVLPDESQPEGSTGRSRKGQFILSGLKVRVSSLSDSTDPPLMFVAAADTDLNQEVKEEDRGPDSISPGDIGGSIVVDDKADSGNSGFRRGGRGWSIIGDERLRRHEAVVVPLESIDLNSSSVVRVTLEQSSRPFKTLMGRFRISFTGDERIRELMLPAVGRVWSAVGPFPATDTATAYRTAFEPEKELKAGVDLKKEYEKPRLPEKKTGRPGGTPGKSGKESAQSSSKAKDPKSAGSGSSTPSDGKSGSPKSGNSSPGPKKPGGGQVAASAAKAGTNKGGKSEKPGGKTAAAVVTKGAPPSGQDSKPGDSGKKDVAVAKTPKKEEKKDESGDKPSTENRRSRRPEKLSWKAHREWRDGRRIDLEDGNVAWYLVRKIESTRPRTVTMNFDGPSGVRAWLNGELIFEAAPTTRTSSRGSRGGGGFRGQSRSSEDRKVRLGIRKGENELVVKVVFGERSSSRRRRGSSGGNGEGAGNPAADSAVAAMVNASDEEIAAFVQETNRRRNATRGSLTFNLSPEGDDVVNHEIVTALRTLWSGAAAVPVAMTKDDSGKTREEMLREKVRIFYRANHDTLGRVINLELKRLERELASLERRMPQALVMEEVKKGKMRDTHVFVRGDFRKKGAKVTAGVPSVLPPMSGDLPKNRLGLARWLVSGGNPLTARVTVNRIWQKYFGTGLVQTAEDFGVRGSAPTHPDLLDWLASGFVASGWDLKKLHKLIVSSATYQQASTVSPGARKRDPENKLMSRGPRQRLSAEMIRDNAMAVSGLLLEKVGGKSAKPYQPEGLWRAVSSGQRYRRDKGREQYRRGLYVYWKRGAPYPSMTTFDAAKRENCTATRTGTTTPLQALVLLNDPVYVEAAKMLGQRMLKEGGKDDAARLTFGYRLCTGDLPTAEEMKILSRLLGEQREHYKGTEADAKKLLAVGDSKIEEALGQVELAAWATVASALLNLDATIHR